MPMNRKRGRRRYRSNPNRGGGRRLFGFQLPPMGDVLFTGAGLIGPNLVSAQILKILPTSLTLKADGTPNTLVIWATKIISVLLPSWLLRRFVNPRAGTAFLIGGSAGLALDALKTYAPGIIPGIGYQPLLGAYFQRPAAQIPFQRPGPRGLPTQVAEAPERLSPQARF
jgi:hypothetical protein